MCKKICIFGGSFDPVTTAHEMVIDEICKLNMIDEIWIIICRYRNDKKLTDFKHRYKMFSLVLDGKEQNSKTKIFLKDLEYTDRETPTYELLNAQKEKFPNYMFYFYIGSDLINEIFRWDNGEILVSENSFLIIERGNIQIDDNILKKFPQHQVIKMKNMSEVNFVSSTEVRKQLAAVSTSTISKKVEENLKIMLNPNVIDYIKKHNLYQGTVS